MRLKDKVKTTVKDRFKLFNQILLERGVKAVKTKSLLLRLLYAQICLILNANTVILELSIM